MEMLKGSFSLEVMDPDNISGWKDEDPYFGSEKRGKNIILYDWFAMTSKVDSVESLLNQLGLKTSLPFKETKGFYGYRSRLKFDGISIYYDYCYKDTDYPLLELTGQGCRDFETYTDGNWGRLFQLALDTDNYHVTRLDVAYDDHEGILDINKIVRKTEKRHFVSRSQVGTITNSFDRDNDAYSVMYGGRSSELYCRIYDKALERGYSDGRHWVRCETVFKGDRAYNFIKNDDPIGAKYCGVLKNYIRFVEPNENDSNKRRWNVSKWWDKFLGDCKRISVCSPKTVDYNLSRVGRYVFHQAGNCVDTYIQCVGIIQFLNELKVRDTVLTPHQKRLIDEYKARIAAENNCNTNTAAGGSDPVFVDRFGNACNANTIKQVFQKLKKCTGIDRLHPHLLRHTFATNYLVDGGDLETLRLILGHSDLQVTSMYLHLAQNKRLLQSKHRSHLDYMVNNERIDTNEEHTKVNQIDRRNL